MDKIARALQFLRITDEAGNLSLTNVGLIVMLGKIAVTPNLAIPDLAMFLATLVGYQVKKFTAVSPTNEDTAALQEAIKSLETKVAAVGAFGPPKRR
jgi:hypothetical protein